MAAVGSTYWMVYGRDLILLEKLSSGELGSVTTTAESVSMYGPRYPTQLTTADLSTESELGSIVDEAVLYKGIQLLYSRGDMFDPRKSAWAQGMYRQALRGVKRFAYRRGVNTSREMA